VPRQTDLICTPQRRAAMMPKATPKADQAHFLRICQRLYRYRQPGRLP
jgi:hypothetical protein